MISSDKKYQPDFALLKSYLDDDYKNKNSGFLKISESNKLTVYKKSVEGSSLAMLRIKILFENMKIDTLFNMICDIEIKKKIDKQNFNYIILETISSNEDIIYFVAKAPAMISNRDFVQYRCYVNNKKDPELIKKYNLWEKPNPYYTLYVKSIVRPDAPEKKGIVRAETILAGWILEEDPNNPKNVTVNMVMHNDIKGSIPIMVMNKFAGKAPAIFMDDIITSYKKYHKDIENILRLKMQKKQELAEANKGEKTQEQTIEIIETDTTVVSETVEEVKKENPEDATPENEEKPLDDEQDQKDEIAEYGDYNENLETKDKDENAENPAKGPEQNESLETKEIDKIEKVESPAKDIAVNENLEINKEEKIEDPTQRQESNEDTESKNITKEENVEASKAEEKVEEVKETVEVSKIEVKVEEVKVTVEVLKFDEKVEEIKENDQDTKDKAPIEGQELTESAEVKDENQEEGVLIPI